MPVELPNTPLGPICRALIFLAKTAVSVELLAVLLSRVETAQLWAGARTASMPGLLVALAADAAGHERLSARMGNIAVAEYGGYCVDTVQGR